jgi:hypothetical protein
LILRKKFRKHFCKIKLVLDNLKKPIDPSIQNETESGDEKAGTVANKPPTYLLSTEFDVINLSEALKTVDQAIQLDKKELMGDVKHGIPRRFLETIVSSPVFYNTNLIPKNKAIYESHFKKFQFTDTEKMQVLNKLSKIYMVIC